MDMYGWHTFDQGIERGVQTLSHTRAMAWIERKKQEKSQQLTTAHGIKQHCKQPRKSRFTSMSDRFPGTEKTLKKAVFGTEFPSGCFPQKKSLVCLLES